MKPRNLVAKDMFTSGLYRAKIVKSKKTYNRQPKHRTKNDYSRT
jgi:stalled ribosome alternative rescue factor ArfA